MTAPLCEYCGHQTVDGGPDGFGGTDHVCPNPECQGLLGYARSIVPSAPTPLSAALAVPEVAALVNEKAFDWLDAPVKRLGAPDVPMPYNDALEFSVIPNQAKIIEAARALLNR